MPGAIRKPLTQSALYLSSDLPGVQFKIADTIDEMEQAFKLLHDCYVDAGFMDQNPEGVRILPQFFLPSTAIIIAKDQEKVIGTMSLIRDNPLGLPMESIFTLSELRKGGRRLTEVSSLAIDKSYRTKGGALFHHLIRFVWNYSLERHGCETFVIAVNPSMAQVYTDIYLFQRLPNLFIKKNYDFVKGAPAVGLFMPADNSRYILSEEYRNRNSTKNVFQFIFDKDILANINEQTPEYFDIYSLSSKPEHLQYFLDHYPLWWRKISNGVKNKFVRLQNALGREQILYPDLIIDPTQRTAPRFDALLKVFTKDANLAAIIDVSKEGFKVRSFSSQASSTIFAFQVGPQKFIRLKANQIWNNDICAGFKILDADDDWNDYLDFVDKKINGPTQRNKKTG